MTEHLTIEERRQQVAEILVTGIFRVFADRTARKSPPHDKRKPAHISLPGNPFHQAEPCL
jgi:hypothetical protein